MSRFRDGAESPTCLRREVGTRQGNPGMGVWKRIFRTPVTSFTLFVLATVYLATIDWKTGEGSSVLERALGQAQQLTLMVGQPGQLRVWHEELYGPFDLWDGEWWRIPVSNLHHVGFLHLFLNSLFVATYGAYLERLWGSLRIFLFFLATGFVCLVPEYLLEHYAAGFSGVGCGIYGALVAMRRTRPDVAEHISPENMICTGTMLLAMVLLTELNIIAIANLAHFTGLFYGWLMGTLGELSAQRRLPAMVCVVGAHVLLVFPYWYTVHPLWTGRYHWYCVTRGQVDETLSPDTWALLERALACDPSLSPLYLQFAERKLEEGDVLGAWTQLLQGLEQAPADEDLWQSTRRMWRRLVVSTDRAAAEAAIQQTFGEAAPQWLGAIRTTVATPMLIAPDQPLPVVVEAPVVTPREYVGPRDGDWWRDFPGSKGTRVPIDAVEGEAL
jgi:membrane associated rhomboid family serine protease